MLRNNFIVKIVFIFASTFIASNIYADDISFRCIVNNEYALSNDGSLVKPERNLYKGFAFSVVRSTGEVDGVAFSSMSDGQVKVIDGGSFKLFSFAENRGVAETLAIRTRQAGKKKSFVGIDYLQVVVTGTCD